MKNGSSRPYRVYNARTEKFERGRCYKYLQRCQDSCLVQCWNSTKPLTFQVINHDTSREIGTWKNGIHGVEYQPH